MQRQNERQSATARSCNARMSANRPSRVRATPERAPISRLAFARRQNECQSAVSRSRDRQNERQSAVSRSRGRQNERQSAVSHLSDRLLQEPLALTPTAPTAPQVPRVYRARNRFIGSGGARQALADALRRPETCQRFCPPETSIRCAVIHWVSPTSRLVMAPPMSSGRPARPIAVDAAT